MLVNKAVAKLYDTAPQDLTGRNHYKIHKNIWESELDVIRETDRKVIENKTTYKIDEERVTDIYGKTGIYQTKKIPFRTQRGNEGVLGVAVNITELKQKEGRLARQKEKLQESYEQLEANNEEFQALNEELEESYKEINELANNIEKMIDITSNLNVLSIDNVDLFLSNLLKTSLKLINKADYGAVAKIDNDQLVFIDAVGHDINTLNSLTLKRENINDLDKIMSLDYLFKEVFQYKKPAKSDKLSRKFLQRLNDSLIVSFNDGQEKVGFLCLSIDKKNKQKFNSNSHRILSAFCSLANGFFKIQKYHQVEEEFQQELIIAITKILELHDTYTEGHSKEVAELSQKIAEKIGLSKEDVEKAYWAGMVHDIGKILISKSILNKKDSLTVEEYNIIKKHPVWGYQALKHSNSLKDIAKIILYHHERWDGRGYPHGLKGNEIPLISRILSVADSWHAMISNRPYRAPLPINKALEEIEANKGTQFCPEVVVKFKEIIA